VLLSDQGKALPSSQKRTWGRLCNAASSVTIKGCAICAQFEIALARVSGPRSLLVAILASRLRLKP
jgi:hypothetical protein